MKAKGIALATIVLTTLVIDAQALTMRGPPSCGAWIKERSQGMVGLANLSWLVGFLSGLANGTNKDFIKGTDNDSLSLWVDNYCRSNPLDSVDDAGLSLAMELIKQKRL